MRASTAVSALLLSGASLSATPQIGYLWSFEELTAKADFVAIVEVMATEDTGRRREHPELRPDLPVVEWATTLKIQSVLKPNPPVVSAGVSVRLRHYRIDGAEWKRRNPPQPGLPVPGGVINSGSHLDFTREMGSDLVFLKRMSDNVFEPLSGQTFPTESVYLLRKPGKVQG